MLLEPVAEKVLSENDRVAAALRERFRECGVLTVNLISSPGAGKTTILEQTLAHAAPSRRLAVLTGDVQTDNDAKRLAKYGYPVHQIGTGGATIDVEGPPEQLSTFVDRLHTERPSASVVLTEDTSHLSPAGFTNFAIRHSDSSDEKTTVILPDLATCPECLAETLDPSARRYQYPFTNCTLCGPRYTIVRDIPYDRPNTTMRDFELCEDCRREYEDPFDRRFHAQPIACPQCGPHLDDTVQHAASVIAGGGIVALKGIGGFQLLADARNTEAIARLRERKHREAKPLAVMMSTVEQVRRYCRVSQAEERVLVSSGAPIVLLVPLPSQDLAANVSDSSPFVGVMLPYSPLHHLLMREFPHPMVATSGNISGDPILIDNDEGREHLGPIADALVTHNRPIARPCDDSVVRVIRGRTSMIRRARGYAPLPVPVGRKLPRILAVGGHLKSAVAITVGSQVVLSQHIGDLDTLASRRAFEQTIDDLSRLYAFQPDVIACDLHPDYASTMWARDAGKPVIAVQHHQVHAASCAAENDIRGPYLAVSWDGTGYGLDQTIWGGEFFAVDGQHFERIAHLRPFALPGGEMAIKKGWRAAASLLWEAGLEPPAQPAIERMLSRRLNSPLTSSVGRLFDAVAALTGVARESRFEGQAAMLLERCADADRHAYPLPDGDWEPLILALLKDRRSGVPASTMAARFHNALLAWIREVAQTAKLSNVVISGGVFQNARLSEHVVEDLESRGFTVAVHQRVPPNDGGLALGQAVMAAAILDAA